MTKDIFLGKTNAGRAVFIKPRDRTTHMQIIGSTGEGKSKFMEHLIRQDIIEENGLCLIDPHGYLYQDIVKWCVYNDILNKRKIILFDPLEDDWSFGFNPLRVKSRDVAYHVDAMVRAVAQVWGGEDTDRTPLLKRCLRLTFHALAEQKHSLLETQYLVNPIETQVRRYLTQDIEDPIIKKQWDYFNTLRPRQFYEEFGSTINRMMEFLSSPIIRNTIGQIDQTIDFRKIMDQGYILLVNLSAKDKISEDNARLLGTLMVNDLFMNAKGRPAGSRPFYLYIDECARFINEDIARILDEGRKFGLHLILAHQHLAQLKKAGEDVYQSVMTDAKTKVIFGGLSAEDARILAEQVFLGELDLEQPKVILNKPVVVGHIRVWLNNYSQSHSQSEGGGRGSSQASGSSTMSSLATTYDSEGNIASTITGKGMGSSSDRAYNESWNWSNFWSTSEGASEALMPELEERPTQVYSLEEQIYKAMALMVNQPMRHAIIKLPKRETQMAAAPFVQEIWPLKPDVYLPVEVDLGQIEKQIQEFKQACFQLADFVMPRSQVEKIIKERWLGIEAKALVKFPQEPENFRE